MKQNSRVLIVGSMAFDDLELPSGKFTDVVGGSATYGAIAASLFAKPEVVAIVGDDFPEKVLSDLAARGVATGGIERVPGKTFRWAGRYADNLASRTTLDTQLNVFADFRPKLPTESRDTPWVLLGNIHPALQLEVLDQMRKPRFVAADTMNFWIERERPTLERLLRRVDALVINDEELRQLAELHNIKRAARRVLGLLAEGSSAPKRLIVKRGEYGSMLFEHGAKGEEIFFSPAYPLEDEVDPTGAGDTFAGALFGCLAEADNLEHATFRRSIVVASTVASHCVEGVGTARIATLTREALSERIEALRALVEQLPH
jgi:sugar/nucleoside kinase (ribokinase family)